MYGYVYKTTNNINNKIYIGQKKSNVFLGTKYLGSGKYLREAVQQFGADNFSVELLASSDDAEQLHCFERYYIKYYGLPNHNIGYNVTPGSIGGDTYSGLLPDDKNRRQEKCKQYTPTKGRIRIHRGDIDKAIYPDELDNYIQSGWVVGVSDRMRKIWGDSHRGIKQNTDWVRKKADAIKNKSGIERELMCKRHSDAARRQMANTPPEERKRRASNANKFKGHKCAFVHKGSEVHFVMQSELDTYLASGYSLGMKDKK